MAWYNWLEPHTSLSSGITGIVTAVGWVDRCKHAAVSLLLCEITPTFDEGFLPSSFTALFACWNKEKTSYNTIAGKQTSFCYQIFGRDMGWYHEETSQPTYTMNQATKHSPHHNKARSLHNRNLAITVKRDARLIGSHGNKVSLINHGPTQIMPNLEAKWIIV